MNGKSYDDSGERAFELGQCAIVTSLAAILLVFMACGIRAPALIAFVQRGQPSQVLSQIVLLLVLAKLFRTLIFYLREHRVSWNVNVGQRTLARAAVAGLAYRYAYQATNEGRIRGYPHVLGPPATFNGAADRDKIFP